MKYIDVHCHVFPENIAQKAVAYLQDYYHFTWQGTGLIGDIKAGCREAGISRSVIFSSATKPAQVPHINDYISSLVREDPELFIGLGTIHPGYPEHMAELDRISALGLRGLKIHPDFQMLNIDAPEMMPVYARTRELGHILLFHTGDPDVDYSSPRRLARVIEAFPGLRIIAAHLGGFGCWDAAEKYIIGKDVWIDVSSAIRFVGPERARHLVLAHGTDRVLFASDYPAVRPKQAQLDLASLGLGPEDMEKICHLNAEKLFGLPSCG